MENGRVLIRDFSAFRARNGSFPFHPEDRGFAAFGALYHWTSGVVVRDFNELINQAPNVERRILIARTLLTQLQRVTDNFNASLRLYNYTPPRMQGGNIIDDFIQERDTMLNDRMRWFQRNQSRLTDADRNRFIYQAEFIREALGWMLCIWQECLCFLQSVVPMVIV